MVDRNYWGRLEVVSMARNADWVGHEYLTNHRCICGRVDCAMQGLCHCGCGEATSLSVVTARRDDGVFKAVLGLPSLSKKGHMLRGRPRAGGTGSIKGKVQSRVADELAAMQGDHRCICGKINCVLQSLCHCGCGGEAKLATSTRVGRAGERISFLGQPLRYIHGHGPATNTGRYSPFFVGELAFQGGCWRRYMPDHPRAQKGRIPEHVWIIEQELGRQLHFYGKNHKDNEVVHHVDLDRGNNERTNLELMTHGEHSRLHRALEQAAIGISKRVRRARPR